MHSVKRWPRYLSAPLATIGAALALWSLGASQLVAQPITCPAIRSGAPSPVELGIASAERGEWPAAARHFEQSQACIEYNRPNVRDSLNGLAAYRTASAYFHARDMANALRIADEALTWHRSYVTRLAPSPDRSDQFNMLIYFHGVRAMGLLDARRDGAEATLNQARALLASNSAERPESALMVLAMLGALIDDDYSHYAPVQRDLIQRLRERGADYRPQLRQELLSFAQVAREHGDIAAAAAAETEARGLR